MCTNGGAGITQECGQFSPSIRREGRAYGTGGSGNFRLLLLFSVKQKLYLQKERIGRGH